MAEHPCTERHRPGGRRGRRTRIRVLITAVVAGTLAAGGLIALSSTSSAATIRQAEALDRGVVSVHTDAGNLVSWRWLGTDDDDVAPPQPFAGPGPELARTVNSGTSSATSSSP